MRREPRWISRALALAIHDRLIAEHGGPPGTRDEGALEAALAAPRNHFYYADRELFALAAAYAHGVTRNHPFVDGNKRVAFTLAAVFLQWNGYRLEATEADAVVATRALPDRLMSFEEFGVWLQRASKRLPRGQSSSK